MNAFMLDHVLLWENDTNTYAKHDAERSKWLNTIIIASSTDALNIRVYGNFYLLPIIWQGGILRLNIIIDRIFFVSEAVVQALHTWIKPFSQEGPSKTVIYNIALLILKFLSWRFYLADMNNLIIEAAIYLLEVLTKFSVEELIKPFNRILQK